MFPKIILLIHGSLTHRTDDTILWVYNNFFRYNEIPASPRAFPMLCFGGDVLTAFSVSEAYPIPQFISQMKTNFIGMCFGLKRLNYAAANQFICSKLKNRPAVYEITYHYESLHQTG